MKYTIQVDENGHAFPVYYGNEEVDTLNDEIVQRVINAVNTASPVVHIINEIITLTP